MSLTLDPNGSIVGGGATINADGVFSTTADISVAYDISTTKTVSPQSTIRVKTQSTGQVIYASLEVIKFNVVDTDTDGSWNPTLNQFKPKIAGWYVLSGTVSMNLIESSTDCFVEIRKNGNLEVRGWRSLMPAESVIGFNFQGMIFLNGTTDYADIQMFKLNTMAIYLIEAGSQTYFSATLVKAY